VASTEPDKRLRVELADGPGYHPTSLAPMTSLATASRSRNVPDAELLTQPQPPVTSPDAGASGPRFSQPLPFCDQTCAVSRKAQQQISFSGLPARRSVMCGLTPRQHRQRAAIRFHGHKSLGQFAAAIWHMLAGKR